MFENIKSDFESNGRSWGRQGFWALIVYRFGRWRYGIKNALLRKMFSCLYHVLYKLVQVVAGIELPCEATIGEGFTIDHFGGIVVSGYSVIGKRCRIRNGVVIGLSRVDEPTAPTIGDDVDIGAGAKLLGPIKIGNKVAIGANAVVLTDVPDDHIAVGVPAIVKTRKTKHFQAPDP